LSKLSPEKQVLLVDALTFAVKMWVDGIKDIVFAFLGLGAAGIDLLRGPSREGFRFYRVMRMGKRVDDALNLYEAEDHSSLEDKID
jgi:hypothetical protein